MKRLQIAVLIVVCSICFSSVADAFPVRLGDFRDLDVSRSADLTCPLDVNASSATEYAVDIVQSATGGGLFVNSTGTGNVVDFQDGGSSVFRIADGGVITQTGSFGSAHTVGSDGVGHTVTFYSDTAGDDLVWSDGDVDLTITGTDGTTALDVPDGNVVINDDLTVTAGDLVVTAGDFQMAGLDQSQLTYLTAAFDIEEATMDADDGSGIWVEGSTINLGFNAFILRAWVDVTQGHGESGDTIELWVNNAEDAASSVQVLVAAQDGAVASLLAFAPSSSATVPIARTTVTNQYILLVYKDVGNDGGTSANLQGKVYVEYLKF